MNHFKFFPHTEEEIQQMLAACGLKKLEDLYAEIPESIRFKGQYELPKQMSELELRQLMECLGQLNDELVVFAGAGCYDHYTPSVVPNIIERSEFLTSYTPYQAEISQGTLHYIFEYQSMMAEMTGMDISNFPCWQESDEGACLQNRRPEGAARGGDLRQVPGHRD